MRIVTVVALVAALAACEKKSRDGSPAAPPSDAAAAQRAVDAAPADPRAAARLKAVEFMEQLARAVDENRSDCAAMTLAVGEVVASNKQFVDVIRAVRARGDSAERQKQPDQVEFHAKTLDEYGDRVAKIKAKLAALDPCVAQSPQLAEMVGDMGKK